MLKDDVVKLAAPELRGEVPSTLVPCLNVTVSPSGRVPSFEETSAENVTVCPERAGLRDELIEIVVGILVTVWDNAAEVFV